MDADVLDLVVRRAEAGYGLVRATIYQVAGSMAGETPGRRSTIREHGRTTDRATAFAYLAEVSHPETRHVIFQATEHWVAIVNNRRDGSDFVDVQPWLSPRMATTTMRVVDQPGVAVQRNGYRCRLHHEARIVEIHEGSSFVRSITCADDGGRWRFDVAGPPLAIEARFDYGARRKRDRFTSDNLATLLDSLGAQRLGGPTTGAGDEFLMFSEEVTDVDWRRRIASTACTVTEAEDPAHGYFIRAQTWSDHLATHASSAVVDLTKAILLNRSYEERSRVTLETARGTLGPTEFDRLVAQAHADLTRGS